MIYFLSRFLCKLLLLLQLLVVRHLRASKLLHGRSSWKLSRGISDIVLHSFIVLYASSSLLWCCSHGPITVSSPKTTPIIHNITQIDNFIYTAIFNEGKQMIHIGENGIYKNYASSADNSLSSGPSSKISKSRASSSSLNSFGLARCFNF